MRTLKQVIVTLEIEAGMIESHAEKLVRTASAVTEEETKREILQLAEEETARAKTLRHQVRLLQDHLADDSSRIA